jgi:hypothetical protein
MLRLKVETEGDLTLLDTLTLITKATHNNRVWHGYSGKKTKK